MGDIWKEWASWIGLDNPPLFVGGRRTSSYNKDEVEGATKVRQFSSKEARSTLGKKFFQADLLG
jgi:hypothetical protein